MILENFWSEIWWAHFLKEGSLKIWKCESKSLVREQTIEYCMIFDLPKSIIDQTQKKTSVSTFQFFKELVKIVTDTNPLQILLKILVDFKVCPITVWKDVSKYIFQS